MDSPAARRSARSSTDVFAKPSRRLSSSSSSGSASAFSRASTCSCHTSPVMVLESMAQTMPRFAISATRASDISAVSTSGCWIRSSPASTDILSPSGDVECVSAISPRLWVSSTITRCASGENPIITGFEKWPVPPYLMKSGPRSRYSLTATRRSSGSISIHSSPDPCVMKSLNCSWKSVSPCWRISENEIVYGPPQPTMLPATSMRGPMVSPRAMASRICISGRSEP